MPEGSPRSAELLPRFGTSASKAETQPMCQVAPAIAGGVTDTSPAPVPVPHSTGLYPLTRLSLSPPVLFLKPRGGMWGAPSLLALAELCWAAMGTVACARSLGWVLPSLPSSSSFRFGHFIINKPV